MKEEDSKLKVKINLNEDKISEYSIQAQWSELLELKKIILEHYKKKKSPLKILDIGIGKARILKHLVKIKEIWNLIESYDGIDVSPVFIDVSNKIIKGLKIEKKATVKLMNAIELKTLNKKYDLIILTGFTAGHFYPFDFNFKNFKPGYNLSKNDKFTMIFQQAYNLLSSEGEIVMGTIYIDNDSTRKKHEEFYKSLGRAIITNEKDSFIATKSKHWSQRFTKQKIYNYLSFIPKMKISFTPLDTYDYAMMVRVKKDYF